MLHGKGLKVAMAFMLGLASLGGCAVPTPSHIIPSETPALTPITGDVTGRLVGYTSNEPKAAATIIMCPMIWDGQYKFVADLNTSTDNDGFFRLNELPPGQYAVLYGLQDEIKPNWKQLDGKILEYKEHYFPTSVKNDIIETFGGAWLVFRVSNGQSGGIVEYLTPPGTEARPIRGFPNKYTITGGDFLWSDFENFSLKIEEGALYSELFGLTMEFLSGKPVTVDIIPGKTANIEIRVTEVIK
jgi:hypothetical protein